MVIGAVTLAVFIRVLWADFVMWDDDISIYLNPAIRSMNLAKIFTDVDSMMRYNPLSLLGWNITYHFFKLNPFWYHFVNWLMHGINASLVFLILRKLLILSFLNRKRLNVNPARITISAGLAALLWSVHPMRVEPAAWCTDRTYCQALLFLLLCLLIYLRANEPGTSISRHYILLTVSVVLYIVSLLSHSIGMTFFLILLVLDIYPFKKFELGRGWWKSSTNRRTLLEKIPFAAAALTVALITVSIRVASAGVWEKPVTLAEFGIFERFMQAMYIWAHYIWRPWYPFNLSPLYTVLVSFNPLSTVFIASAILVIVTITLAILLRRRLPLAPAFVICHLLLLAPVLGIFEHPHSPCDRYSLIVSMLWSILLAAWLSHPKIKTAPLRISVALSIIVISALGLLTFRQTQVWTNSKTLFAHMIKTLKNDPYRYDIYHRLGNVYLVEGNIEEAMAQYRNAVRINPNFMPSRQYICLMLLKQGKLDEAAACLNELLPYTKNSVELNYNIYADLGETFKKRGDFKQAIESWTTAIELKPNSVIVLNHLARLLVTTGDVNSENTEKGIMYAGRACELTGYKQAVPLDTLAAAYAAAGKFSEAKATAEKAIEAAKATKQEALVRVIESRLELYQSGRPYHEK